MFERALATVFENGRSLGVTDFLHGEASAAIIILFALLSQLGDVWFLFLLSGALYVAGEYTPRTTIDRRRGLFVLALLLTYVALVGVLKDVFSLGRPPGATFPPGVESVPPVLRGAFADITTAEGPGFPSGHALGTTMVWGGLALVLDVGTARVRAGLVAVVVALVSLSRLVLGVHYLVDVVAGIGVGLVVLAGLYRFSERGTDPGRVLGFAVAVAVIGVALGVTFESVAALGGATGGWLVWRAIAHDVSLSPSNAREVVVGFGILGVVAVLFGALYAFEWSHSVTFLGTALTVGVAVGAPLLGERLR